MSLLLTLALTGPAEPFDAVPIEPPIPYSILVVDGDDSESGDWEYVLETPLGIFSRPHFGPTTVEPTSGGLRVLIRNRCVAGGWTIDEFVVREGRLLFVRQFERNRLTSRCIRLDGTVNVYTSDAAETHHSSGNEWPLVLLGTLGGRLRGGTHIEYPGFGETGNRSINALY